jgi:hypothetical protein
MLCLYHSFSGSEGNTFGIWVHSIEWSLPVFSLRVLYIPTLIEEITADEIQQKKMPFYIKRLWDKKLNLQTAPRKGFKPPDFTDWHIKYCETAGWATK